MTVFIVEAFSRSTSSTINATACRPHQRLSHDRLQLELERTKVVKAGEVIGHGQSSQATVSSARRAPQWPTARKTAILQEVGSA
jgi:hypothetical protein